MWISVGAVPSPNVVMGKSQLPATLLQWLASDYLVRFLCSSILTENSRQRRISRSRVSPAVTLAGYQMKRLLPLRILPALFGRTTALIRARSWGAMKKAFHTE